MMDAIKATAGLAMSTFKDDVEPGAPGADDDDDIVHFDSRWKPTPELKAKMLKPIGGDS